MPFFCRMNLEEDSFFFESGFEISGCFYSDVNILTSNQTDCKWNFFTPNINYISFKTNNFNLILRYKNLLLLIRFLNFSFFNSRSSQFQTIQNKIAYHQLLRSLQLMQINSKSFPNLIEIHCE